jgi:hypothetical protein
MLQIAPAAVTPIRIVEWGYNFSTIPATTYTIELVDTGAVFGSVMTAHVAGGVPAYNAPTGHATSVQLGAALTAFSTGAITEGSITATRLLGMNADTAMYFKQQFPLGREPEVAAGQCLRIRSTPATAVSINMACYVIWEE